MSEKQYRDKIAQLTRARATEEQVVTKARAAGNKFRADAAKEINKITARTNDSTARMYQRNADNLLKKGEAEDRKLASATSKLSQVAKDLASAEASLEREIKTTSSREEQRRKQQQRQADQDLGRRRQQEVAHAREVARLSQPTVRYVHEVREVPQPKPEELRILYLTSNPEMNLRTEAEVRNVRESIRRATHREAVTVDFRSAATPEDLLDGLNQLRPHVVHFSGHAGDAALLFDNASVDAPEGRDVPYDLLVRALGATDLPPVVLVLNGCDTLDGAELLLQAVGVVIATAASISDLAAALFAARFYAAVAEAQPIAAALDQAAVAIDLAGLEEGWKPQVISRPDVDLTTRVLVRGTS
jgi:hypothetical protein